MKFFSILFTVFVFTGIPAQAETQKYFYSVAQTETDDPSWVFLAPECKVLDGIIYKNMKKNKKCTKQKKGVEQCNPEKPVTLENVTTKEKRKFELSYFVFNSLKSCQNDRKEYFQSSDL